MIQEMDRLPIGDVTFDAYITMNGQLTLDKDKQPLYGMPVEGIPKEFSLRIFEEKEIPVILVERPRLYLNFDSQRVKEIQASISSKAPPVGEYEGADFYQACIYVTPEQEHVLDPIREHCEITRWNPGSVDVIAKGGGKRNAVCRYLEENGIAPEEIIAFGDAENDMGMLRLAGIGVALGNAEDQVKAIADYVTDDIDEDGVANALKHFKLI
jgi:Cof subfamily protein (haloacid dehalogenase superfamily)